MKALGIQRKLVFTIVSFLAVVFIAGCGDDKGSGGDTTQPLPVPGGNPVPTSTPGSERFDLYDNAFRNIAGWQVDSTGQGRQSYSPQSGGIDLSVASPFEHEGSHCAPASVTFLQAGILKDVKDATIELQFSSQEFPKNLEYQFRVQAYVGPGRRLVSFTPRGVRTFNSDASFQVAPLTLTPGDHTVRLVATDTVTGLYLDGKKLGQGVFNKGYLPGGGNPGDLVIELAAFDKAPARSGDDCAPGPARIALKNLRIGGNAYFLP